MISEEDYSMLCPGIDEKLRESKILMLGNIFTAECNKPEYISMLTGSTVVAHTRGGASLAECLNTVTKLGKITQKALTNDMWDFVILHEAFSKPIKYEKAFYDSVDRLCKMSRASGAVPILIEDYNYPAEKMLYKRFGMGTEEISDVLFYTYHKTAAANDCIFDKSVIQAIKGYFVAQNAKKKFDAYPSDNFEMWLDFPKLMWGSGFEMDCEQSFARYAKFNGVKSISTYSRQDKKIMLYLLEHADEQLVGNYLFSYWRYWTHWAMGPCDEYEYDYVHRIVKILEDKIYALANNIEKQ